METQQPPSQPIIHIQKQKEENLLDLIQQLKSGDNALKVVATKKFSDLEDRVGALNTSIKSLESYYSLIMDIVTDTQTDINNLKKEIPTLIGKYAQSHQAITLPSKNRESNNPDQEQNRLQKYNAVIQDIESNLQKRDTLKTRIGDSIEYKKQTTQFIAKAKEDFIQLQQQNVDLIKRLEQLELVSASSNPRTVFLKYFCITGILTLLVGIVLFPEKVMPTINSIFNQKTSL